jgi:hypothetical protein
MADYATRQSGAEDGRVKTSQQIPPLPHSVWRRIAYFLSDCLPALINFASLSADLRRICRPHISSFFQTINEAVPPLSKSYYYHDLVWLILAGHLDPSVITELHHVFQFKVLPPLTSSPTTLGTLAESATEQAEAGVRWTS